MIGNISAAVFFVQDLDACAAFYRDVVGLESTFSDDVSCAFRLGEQDFVLLHVSAAVEMISEEAVMPGVQGGQRVLLCAEFKQIDAAYEALVAKGLTFIKPPIDQAWGRRTAYFADPEGNLWEMYQHLA
jgi:catechol 2,3-dioxygenase-like lactoylglutathione lyase family enzyme